MFKHGHNCSSSILTSRSFIRKQDLGFAKSAFGQLCLKRVKTLSNEA